MSIPSPLLISAAALLLGAGGASAQASAFVAGGAVVPLGDFATIAKAGPAVSGGVVFDVGVPRLDVGVEASYGGAGHTFGDARSDVFALMGFAGYTLAGLGSLEVRPLAGLGALAHARRSSDFPGLDATRAGMGAMLGIRVTLPLDSLSVFVSGGYVRGLGDLSSAAFPTELALVAAGVTFLLRG